MRFLSFCVFWFLVRCLLPLVAVLLLLGLLFGKISGANFCFLGVGVGHVFFGAVFADIFALCFGGLLPKVFEKSSLDVRSVFWVRSLFLRFFRRRRLCFLNSRGLSSLAPSEAPFLGTRGGRGVSWLLVLGFCFSPFVLRLRAFYWRARQWLDLRPARGARRPAPSPE